MSRKVWFMFLAACVFTGAATGVFDTSFNNYLSDTFRISASVRGFLEFPRELPGALIALIFASLAFLPEVRVGVIAVAIWSLGLMGLALFSPSFLIMVIWMTISSTGSHLYMPLNQAIGVNISEDNGHIGKRLGTAAGASAAAVIFGAGMVWAGTKFLGLSYRGIFLIASFSAVLGSMCLLFVKTRPQKAREREWKTRLVLKKRYSLFYILSMLYGARKQVFLTFAPWVIIRVFGQPASTIAMLWMIASSIGMVAKPLIGRLIDAVGERIVLMGEAVVMVLVCLGYACGRSMPVYGLYLTYACFMMDQILMGMNIARTTYLCKTTEDPRDLTPTLSLGISADHIVAMMIPSVGGLLWTRFGYEYVFLAAAGVATVNLFAAANIPRKSKPSPIVSESGTVSI